MTTELQILEDVQRANRDNNLELAHKMRDRGANPMVVKRYVSMARHWNHSLIKLIRDSGQGTSTQSSDDSKGAHQ